jgi:tRNA A37 threonylcarbamoyladenosine modification protein TsaB
MILINEFLTLKKTRLDEISEIYINRGPGSFAGIRNSIAIVKAIFLAKKIDYYCFSFEDFENQNDIKYENIPDLCAKYDIKKNLIKPIYTS